MHFIRGYFYMIKAFFYLNHFRTLGQKSKNNFVCLLVQMRTRKFASEIYWPLEIRKGLLERSESTGRIYSLKNYKRKVEWINFAFFALIKVFLNMYLFILQDRKRYGFHDQTDEIQQFRKRSFIKMRLRSSWGLGWKCHFSQMRFESSFWPLSLWSTWTSKSWRYELF